MSDNLSRLLLLQIPDLPPVAQKSPKLCWDTSYTQSMNCAADGHGWNLRSTDLKCCKMGGICKCEMHVCPLMSHIRIFFRCLGLPAAAFSSILISRGFYCGIHKLNRKAFHTTANQESHTSEQTAGTIQYNDIKLIIQAGNNHTASVKSRKHCRKMGISKHFTRDAFLMSFLSRNPL